MKNLSLNAKVAFSMSILGVGALAIGYLGLSKMEYMNGILLEITGPLMQRDQLTSNILDQQRQVSILNRDIIIEKRVDKMHRLEQELGPVRDKLLDLVKQYADIASPEGKELAKKYEAVAKEWIETNRLIRDATKAGRDDEVQKLVEQAEQPQRQATLQILKDINVLTAQRLTQAVDESAESYRAARTLVIVISLLALAIGGLLAFFVMRAVSKAIDQVIASLNDNSAQVTSAAQQIAASSEQLSQAATEQAASLQQTASSIDQMSSMVQKNAENAEKSSQISEASQRSAAKGKDVVEEMIRTIGEINESNQDIVQRINESNTQIGEIVQVISEIGNKTKVINDIVFQTKLLSFNASVEAARAGEHGKGFAVVAEEVGNLAQMSGNAAKEITAMLDSSIRKVEGIVVETKSKVEGLVKIGREKVDNGSEVARQCGEVLNEIVGNVTNVSGMVTEIAAACREQAQGVQEITKAMGQLDQVTQENASTSEEAASAAEELSAQSESLQAVVQVLIHTVKGGDQPARVPADTPRPASQGKVLPFKSVSPLKSAKSETVAVPALKKAVGYENGDIPAGDDPRFQDV